MYLVLNIMQSDLVLEDRVPEKDACMIMRISGNRIYVGGLLGQVCDPVAGFPPLSRR